MSWELSAKISTVRSLDNRLFSRLVSGAGATTVTLRSRFSWQCSPAYPSRSGRSTIDSRGATWAVGLVLSIASVGLPISPASGTASCTVFTVTVGNGCETGAGCTTGVCTAAGCSAGVATGAGCTGACTTGVTTGWAGVATGAGVTVGCVAAAGWAGAAAPDVCDKAKLIQCLIVG